MRPEARGPHFASPVGVLRQQCIAAAGVAAPPHSLPEPSHEGGGFRSTAWGSFVIVALGSLLALPVFGNAHLVVLACNKNATFYICTKVKEQHTIEGKPGMPPPPPPEVPLMSVWHPPDGCSVRVKGFWELWFGV